MTIVFKISDNTKEKMIIHYKNKRREKTPPYAVFQAEEGGTIITLYESNKVMFQGISADIDANMWKEMEAHLNNGKLPEESKKKEKNKDIDKTDYYFISSIGSDEVGTGDFFGPIVVTSTYVQKKDIAFLEELGIKDSKKMTDEKIIKIVPEIIKRIPYSSVILTNSEYNEKYSANCNMNKIKAILHNKVLLNLVNKGYSFDKVVVDQFTPPRTYFNYLKESNNVFRNISFTTKAEDKCLSVACASIISRYIFITEMNKLSKQIGITLPKGAGETVDKIANEIVSRNGIERLKSIAKLNFKNYEKIKQQ